MSKLNKKVYSIYLITINPNRSGEKARSKILELNTLFHTANFHKYIDAYDMILKCNAGHANRRLYKYEIKGGIEVGKRYKRFHGHYKVNIAHKIAIQINRKRLLRDAKKILGYEPYLNIAFAHDNDKQIEQYIAKDQEFAKKIVTAPSALRASL